jgi:signal transduction histidine kinase/AraC-like DNA-binding protein/CheY-like chemotaxis protein
MTKFHGINSIFIICCICLISCTEKKEKVYKIGFSQCVTNDAWRMAMHDEIYRELSFHPEMSIIIKDAKRNNELQIQQIEELFNEGIDLLIVSPNESEPITKAVERIYQSGIPVIVMDRKTTSNLYSAYIGGDNYGIGISAGQYLSNVFQDGSKVVEIWGLPGSSPAKERNEGLLSSLMGTDIMITSTVAGEWEKDISKENFKKFLLENSNIHFDVVFAHNDVMAIGAKEICDAMGIRGKKFIGIDALPGPYGGIQAINDGVLDASFIYPTGGEKAIEVARKILLGEPYEKENILQTAVVDSSNIRIMKPQTDRILNQQQNIIRQNVMLDSQIEIYRSQRGLIIVFGITLFVSIFSLAYVFKSLKDKQEINKKLKRNYKKYLVEQKKVHEYSQKAEEAIKHKLDFFTNISHEFRTPLTLIFAPLEEIMLDDQSFKYRKDLNLIKKNTVRLLRLINQLMDFRKIDSEKFRLKVSEQNLIPFLIEITDVFKKTAKDNQINFKVDYEGPELKLWFDPGMFDKIIFNLLSNAFKFCKPKGFVHLSIKDNQESGKVSIIVSNSDCSIKPEELPYIFDRFFQGKDQNGHFGTGLGLALTKELTELHGGSIICHANSTTTEFTLVLLKGNEHLKEHEFIEFEDQNFLIDNKLNQLYLNPEICFEQNSKVETIRENTLLIVEDDPEIRRYLKESFESDYFVFEAIDPISALQQAREQMPDLITCDLMLASGTDGMNFIKDLKKDPITSSIPIIIVTAKSSDQIRLEGIMNGIEDFIIKPFSITFLKERIKNILLNRMQLKKQYLHQLPIGIKTSGERRDKKGFSQIFGKLLEENIADPDFGIDEICRELGLSRGQLYRKVRENFGYSVNDYLLKVKLKKSKSLLLDGALAISEISTLVGYKSPAYFSTAFKNHFGMSPSDFIKESKNK